MSAVSRTRALTLSLLLGISSLTGCALSESTEPVSAAVVHEEDPAFDCLTDGNGICGAVMADEETLTDAWATWDAQQGWTQLRVDPSREFRVALDAYTEGDISQGPGTVILVNSDGMRYRFTVTYL